jgi:hypothetical protein
MFEAGLQEPFGAMCVCEVKTWRERKWREHVEHVETNATLAVNVGVVAATSQHE